MYIHPLTAIPFLLTICALSNSAFAETACSQKEPNATIEECECLKKTPGATVEACELELQDKKTENTDRLLNSTYRKLTSQLDKDRKAKLVAAQRLWNQFRVKDCEFSLSTLDGGSPIRRNIFYAGCVEDQLRIRNKQLQEICKDMDIKCE